MKDEEGSRFKDNPVLAERYLLLRLLGKGRLQRGLPGEAPEFPTCSCRACFWSDG